MIHLCIPKLYEFEGWFFEIGVMGMPWPLKADGEPRKRAGRKFYAMHHRWNALPSDEKEKTRVGGGCVTLRDERESRRNATKEGGSCEAQ